MSGKSEPRIGAFYGGESDLHRSLRDVEERYFSVFQEFGADAATDFKRYILSLKVFISLLYGNPVMDSNYKLKRYNKIKSDVSEFCGYYARWLGGPLMERLKAEICEILEEAVDWGRTASHRRHGGVRR